MKTLKHLTLVAAMLCCGAANATIVSSYGKADATTAGWTIVYQGGYGTSFDYAAILDNIAPGSKVALASSSSNGAATFDLFANTTLATLQTITAVNTTIFADNAYWYRNYASVGFAPTATITQGSADTYNSNVFGYNADLVEGTKRMSWHGGQVTVGGGWRSGLNVWLNDDQTWQRYVLVQNDEPAQHVPEPASLALIGLGLAGVVAARRKKA